MNIADLGDVKLHWREDGDAGGRPVVFANSLGTDLRLWDKLIPRLPQDLRLIRYDKRGHGLSSCPPAPYTMEALVADAERLLDLLGVRDCVFVGLSIGGLIGQGLAVTRPDLIRALVLSNTGARIGTPEMWGDRIAVAEASGVEPLADGVVERWFTPAFRATDELFAWRTLLARTPAAGYAGCCAAIAGADLRASTAELKLPTLGIAGSDDGATPPELVHETAASIAGARVEVIGEAGHLPCIEQPEQYAEVLTGFLREVSHV